MWIRTLARKTRSCRASTSPRPEITGTDHPRIPDFPEEPMKLKVRVTMNGVVANDLVLKKGDTAELDPKDADRLVAAGKATHAAVRVRVLKHCLISNTIY